MKRALALAALVLAACSNPTSGTVAAKEYKAAYSWVQMQCAAYNKQGICSVYVPITHREPECWRLTIRNEDDKWNVCTSKEEWDKAVPGDTQWGEPS